jgi:hypothetical protein
MASEPNKFLLPPAIRAPLQLCLRPLYAIDHDELHELIVDAWRMVVPKKVSAAYEADAALPPPPAIQDLATGRADPPFGLANPLGDHLAHGVVVLAAFPALPSTTACVVPLDDPLHRLTSMGDGDRR